MAVNPTRRCQLRYQDPRTLQWLDCAQLTLSTVSIGGTLRRVCDEHLQQVRNARTAGLADRLQWVDNPAPARRARRGVVGQRSLELTA
jgi:hypothetical protein